MKPTQALRAAGSTGARAARAGLHLAITPVVHPWMTCDPGQVRGLVTQLDGHLARLDEAAARTARWWPGSPAPIEPPAPGEAATPAALAALRAAITQARDAYAGLADALEAHGPGLREAVAQLPDAATDLDRLRRLRRTVREHTDSLSEADVVCRRALEAAIRQVPDGAALIADVLPGAAAPEPPSEPEPSPAASSGAPAESPLGGTREAPVESSLDGAREVPAEPGPGGTPEVPADATAADDAAADPGDSAPGAGAASRTAKTLEAAKTLAAAATPGSAQARDLRARLAPLRSGRIRAYLARHPEAVEPLVASSADLDLLPAGVTAELLTVRHPADPAVGCADIERRRDALGAHAEASLRAGLLWPALIGPLDGAPVAARVAANRLLLRAELGRARRADVELEMRAIARRVADAGSRLRRVRGAILRAWLTRDAITSYVTTTTDLPLLLRADLRVRILLYQGLLYDRAPGDDGRPGRRRLLLFEPAGRGRLAELWGHLDDRTDALAVFVPGTGTAVRGFHLPTKVARDLVGQVEAGQIHTGQVDTGQIDAGQVGAGQVDVGQVETGQVEAGRDDAAPEPAPTPATSPRERGERACRAAVIAWMGADFPLAIGSNAPFAHYAIAAAGPLRDFVLGLPRPKGCVLTVLGHSYGGTIVGAAERLGVPADRVVHVASPGAGPGVRDVGDYPALDPLGHSRAPHRFTLTAPGDPIRWVQRLDVPWRLLPQPVATALQRVVAGLSLGVDPERLEGIEVLPAGTWEVARGLHAAGAPVSGPSAHAAVMEPGTGSFRRIAGVIAGVPGGVTGGDRR